MDRVDRIALMTIGIALLVLGGSGASCTVLTQQTSARERTEAERERTAAMRACVERGFSYVSGNCLAPSR